MDSCDSPSNDDISSVIDDYFGMFANQSYGAFFADNSVVDFFGKRVKGAQKIESFLKHEVGTQYIQSPIDEPEECGPIETKPIHFQTKRSYEKLIKKLDKKSRLNMLNKITMKKKADSDTDSDSDDDDDDDDDVVVQDVDITSSQNAGYRTPERSIVPLDDSGITNLTPPPSSQKKNTEVQSSTQTDCDDIDCCEAEKAKTPEPHTTVEETKPLSKFRPFFKNLKRTRSFTYLKRFPSKLRKSNSNAAVRTKKFMHDDDEECDSLESSSSDEEFEKEISTEHHYTPLKYIRVTGFLQAKQSLFDSSIRFKHTDTQIRLSLSYRRHLLSNIVQFALVLYEKLDDNGEVLVNKKLIKRKLFELDANSEHTDNNESIEDGSKDEPMKTDPLPKAKKVLASSFANAQVNENDNEDCDEEDEEDEEEPEVEEEEEEMEEEDDEEAISSSSTLVNVSERSSDTASLTSIDADNDSLTSITPVTDSLAWLNPFNSTNSMNISPTLHTTYTPSALVTPTTPPASTIDAMEANSLRTPSKTTGSPSAPKRKSKQQKTVPNMVLKRLQESSMSVKPPPKSTAARCLRL